MTKLDEFEQKLIQNGISKDDFVEYERLLKRVNSNYNRLQHCYTMAVQLPEKYSERAAELIKWGLEKYPCDAVSTYRAYSNLGLIYEKNGQYRLAYDAYLQADAALDEEETSYHRVLTGDLLWTLLHADQFRYSEGLEHYYTLFNSSSDFDKSFLNHQFCLAVASLVISLHHGDAESAKQAYQEAKALADGNQTSRQEKLLKPKGIEDTLRITPECRRFLKRVKL